MHQEPQCVPKSFTTSRLPMLNPEIQLVRYSDKSKYFMKDLYSQGPCLLYCVRSTSCPLCKKMTKFILDAAPKFEKLGVKLYCIAKYVSSDDFISKYWTDLNTIFIDPQYDLFRLVGDESGEFRKFELMEMFTKKFYHQVKTALDENHSAEYNFMTQNLILGGSVLISREGEVVFRTLEQSIGTLPDIDGLLCAAGALQKQETAAMDYEMAMSPDNLKSLGFDFSKIDH